MIKLNLFIVNCQLAFDLLVYLFTVWSLLIDCQWYDEAIGDDQIRLPGLLLHTIIPSEYHYRVPTIKSATQVDFIVYD